MTKEYKEYLLSDEWAQLKIDLFELRGKVCEKCSSRKNIAVHHLHYDNIFNEEPEDLIILCGYHHAQIHGKIKPKKKKPKCKIKKKVSKPKKNKPIKPKKKKQTMSFVKEGNCTMVITRTPIKE